MQLTSLNDVFADQIVDLHSAERQLVEALPRLAAAAHSDELREAFNNHLAETRGHVERLDNIAATIGISPSKTCKAMKGILAEGDEVAEATGDPAAKDAALIAAAQRAEHYEIASYGTARTLADTLGLDGARDLLDDTLDEEGKADKKLTKIATGGIFASGINADAAI